MAYTQDQINAMTTEQLKAAITELQEKPDLAGLSADQLIALSEQEWAEFDKTVKAAIAAKEAEAKAALKEKIAKAVDTVKTYVLPVVKYAAGAAVLLRVFGVI